MKIALNLSLFFFLLGCHSIDDSPIREIPHSTNHENSDMLSEWVYELIRGPEIKADPYKLVDSAVYSEISTPLAHGALKEYLSSNMKDSIELYFDKYAGEKWENVKRLNEIDSVPFEHEFFGEGVFTSKIEKAIVEENYTLLLLKMNRKDGEPWTGGVCPGLGWIIKMDHVGNGYVYGGSTGLFKYSFKYGRSPKSIEIRNINSTPYLEVRTDAGGMGQGREGIVLYSMDPFGEILFNNIFLTFYSDIRWLPKDTARSMWAFKLLDVNPSKWDGSELHLESLVSLSYNVSADFSEIEIEHKVNTTVFTYSNRASGQMMYADTIPEFSFNQFYYLRKN